MGNKVSSVNWCKGSGSKCWSECDKNGDISLAPTLSNANVGSDVVGNVHVYLLLSLILLLNICF